MKVCVVSDSATNKVKRVGVLLQVHTFALVAYDSVVYLDTGDTLVNSGVHDLLAAFASGSSEWAGRSDMEPACPDGVFDVRLRSHVLNLLYS